MLIRSILLKIGAARNTSLESSVWGLARHCHPGHSGVPDGSQTRALQGSLQHSSRSGRSPSLPACPIPWLTWRAQLLEDRRKGMGKATLSLTTPTATLWVSPASPVTSHSASLSPHSQAGDCWSSNKVKLTVPFNYWWFPLRPTTLPATWHPGHSHSPLSTINILIETWKLNPELFTVRLDTTLLVLERALHVDLHDTAYPPPTFLLLEIYLLGHRQLQNDSCSRLPKNTTRMQGLLLPTTWTLPGHSIQQSTAAEQAIFLPLKLLLRKIFKIKIFLHFASDWPALVPHCLKY